MADIVFILNGAIDRSGVFSGGDRHTVGLIKHCIEQGDKVRIMGPEGSSSHNAKDLKDQEWLFTERGPLPDKYKFGRIPFTLLKYLFRTIKGKGMNTSPCDVLYSGSILPHETLIGKAWKKRSLCKKYVCRCDQVFHLEPFRQKPEYTVQRIASQIGMYAALNSADMVITMNTLISSQWKQEKESTNNKPQIESVYYGLDDDLTPYKLTEEKEYDLAFFCRLDHVKGADLIPGILKALASERPDIKLLVIGDGPLRKFIEDEIKSSGLEKNIDIKGIINTCERFELLAKSRLLLYPTREDSFAKSVAESLALGIPVISSNNPHFHAVYDQTLVYADSEDPKNYATRILSLLNDKSAYNEKVKQALSFADNLPPKGNYAKFRELILQG